MKQAREGFTLIEVTVALVIAAVAVLGLGVVSGNMVGLSNALDRGFLASQLVEDRLEQIQVDPRYTALDTLYEGTETSIPGFPDVVRVTDITRVLTEADPGKFIDYRKVTVTVTVPGLANPVSRTVSVGKP